MTVVTLPAARKQEQQKMAPFRWWLFSAAVLCAVFMQGCAQRLGLFSRWRKCVLPHERRARLWERYERYCIDGRKLEWRRRKSRCICEDGYYRDEETQNCFAEDRCGHCNSARHESFNSCLGCELICGQPVIQQCDKTCKPGCQCIKGYIRRRQGGRCVPIMSCPPKCPLYMRFVLNRERCPRVCNEAREDTCVASNEGPGCVCRPGFVLKAIFGTIRTNDWCVHESMCRFPDEEPKTNKGGIGDDVKGSWDYPAKGNGDNRFSDQSKGGQVSSLEPSEPTKSGDDLFRPDKGYPPLPDLNGWKSPDWLQKPIPPEPKKTGNDVFGPDKGFPPLPDLNRWKNPGWLKKPGPSKPKKSGNDVFRPGKGFPPLPDINGWKGHEWLTGGSRTKGHGESDMASTKKGYPDYPDYESKPPDDWFVGGGQGQGSKKGNNVDEGLVATKVADWWLPKEEQERKIGGLFDVDVVSRGDTDESSLSEGRRRAIKGGVKDGAGDGPISRKGVDGGLTSRKSMLSVEDSGQKRVNLGAFEGQAKHPSLGLSSEEKISEGLPLKLRALQRLQKSAASKNSSDAENAQESEKTSAKPLEAQTNIDLEPGKKSREPAENLVKEKAKGNRDKTLVSHGASFVHKLIGTGIGMGEKFFSGLKNVTSIGGLVDHSLSVLASGVHSLSGSGGQSNSNSEQKSALV